MRLCHKWHPEETNTDQKAEQEGEVGERRDYYNVIPGKTPAGGIEHQRITREESNHDADKQRVGVNGDTKLQHKQYSVR